MTARVTARTRSSIAEHVRASGASVACGILIGLVDGGRVRVERSLRCFNAIGAAQRSSGFRIDPRVLLNVGRSMRDAGASVVGFYYGGGGIELALSPFDREQLRRWPGTLLAIASAVPDGNDLPLAAWSARKATGEIDRVELEIVVERERPLLVCPE